MNNKSSIESEIREVHERLDAIERKQDMLRRLYQQTREHDQKFVHRPFGHKFELT